MNFKLLAQFFFPFFFFFQAESISAALSGKNVAVATMTSSGKSLCYNIPVFEELTKDTDACALYLFPTKVTQLVSFPKSSSVSRIARDLLFFCLYRP